MINKKSMMVILLIALMFTASCQKNIPIEERYETLNVSEYVDKTPAKGGELVLPLSVVDTLNPLLTKNESYYYFSKLIYEGLYAYDETGSIVPQLAKEIRVSPDHKTVNILLRDDVYWHDGAKLNADDVAMSFRALRGLEEDNPYRQLVHAMVGEAYGYDINQLFSIDVIDPLQVEMVFDRSYQDVQELLTIPIMPAHLLSDGGVFTYSDFKPIGTGPYQFYQYKSGREIRLKRNENYYESAPYIESIVGKIYRDASRSTIAFDTGQIDASLAIDSDWEKYKEDYRFTIIPFATREVEMLAFNMTNPRLQGDTGVAVRQAVSMAINKGVIIERVFLGNAEESKWLLHPQDPRAKYLNVTTTYDLERAKATLDEAGLLVDEQTGYRRWPDGAPLKLSLVTNFTNRNRNLIARYVAEDLRQIGIEPIMIGQSNIGPTTNEDNINQDYQETMGRIARGEFDIALFARQLSPITDLSSLLSSAAIDGQHNVARYQNDDVDHWVRWTKHIILPEKEAVEPETEQEPLSIDQGVYGAEEFSAPQEFASEGDQPDVTALDLDKLYNQLMEYTSQDPAYVVLCYKKRALLLDYKVGGDPKPTDTDIYRNIKKMFIPIGLQ